MNIYLFAYNQSKRNDATSDNHSVEKNTTIIESNDVNEATPSDIKEGYVKESPTQLLKKQIPDYLWDDITNEIQSKDEYEALYVIYEKVDGPEEILIRDGVVGIVDSIKYEEIIKEEFALREFTETDDLVAYLEEAKKKGAQYIQTEFYTEVGSDKTGRPYFVKSVGYIEDVISDIQGADHSKEFEEIENELSTVDGVDLKDIQAWLGHSDFATTANIYSHLDATSKTNSLCALEGVISL